MIPLPARLSRKAQWAHLFSLRNDMLRIVQEHTASGSTSWMPARNSETAYSLHTHTAQALVSSGTLTGGVTIYGTNDESDTVGHVIVTFTFTAAANGDRATPVFSQHSWEFVRSECTSISGTSARLRVTVAGA